MRFNQIIPISSINLQRSMPLLMLVSSFECLLTLSLGCYCCMCSCSTILFLATLLMLLSIGQDPCTGTLHEASGFHYKSGNNPWFFHNIRIERSVSSWRLSVSVSNRLFSSFKETEATLTKLYNTKAKASLWTFFIPINLWTNNIR